MNIEQLAFLVCLNSVLTVLCLPIVMIIAQSYLVAKNLKQVDQIMNDSNLKEIFKEAFSKDGI